MFKYLYVCDTKRKVFNKLRLTFIIPYFELPQRSFVILFRIRFAGRIGLAWFLLDLKYTTLAEAALERIEFAFLSIVRVNIGEESHAAAAGQSVETGITVTRGDIFAGSASRDRLWLLLVRRKVRDYCVGRAATFFRALVMSHNRVAERKGKRKGEDERREFACVATDE